MIVVHYIDKGGKQMISDVPDIRVYVGRPCSVMIELRVTEDINVGPEKGKQRQFLVSLATEDIQRLKEAFKVIDMNTGRNGEFIIPNNS